MRRGVKTVATGGSLVLIGIIVFALTIFSLNRGDSSEAQFMVPATFRVETKESGRYWLWDNYRTTFEGQKFQRNRSFPADLEVNIRDSGGVLLEFVRDDSKGWNVGNHSKAGIGYVDIQAIGEVSIEVLGSSDDERVLSFSKSELLQALGRTFLFLGVSVVSGLLGFPILIWGFAKLVFRRNGPTQRR